MSEYEYELADGDDEPPGVLRAESDSGPGRGRRASGDEMLGPDADADADEVVEVERVRDILGGLGVGGRETSTPTSSSPACLRPHRINRLAVLQHTPSISCSACAGQKALRAKRPASQPHARLPSLTQARSRPGLTTRPI